MPPRRQDKINANPLPRDLYRQFQTTKAEVVRLRALPLDEADALIADEQAREEDFAQRRYEFLYEELMRPRELPERVQGD